MILQSEFHVVTMKIADRNEFYFYQPSKALREYLRMNSGRYVPDATGALLDRIRSRVECGKRPIRGARGRFRLIPW
jgi:hypothetical protein